MDHELNTCHLSKEEFADHLENGFYNAGPDNRLHRMGALVEVWDGGFGTCLIRIAHPTAAKPARHMIIGL